MMYTINKPTGTTMRDHPNSPPTFQQKTMTKSKSRYMKATNCPSQKSRYFNSNTSSLPPSFKTASSNSKSRHSKLSKRSSKSHKSKSKKRKRSSKTKRKSNSLKTKVWIKFFLKCWIVLLGALRNLISFLINYKEQKLQESQLKEIYWAK